MFDLTIVIYSVPSTLLLESSSLHCCIVLYFQVCMCHRFYELHLCMYKWCAHICPIDLSYCLPCADVLSLLTSHVMIIVLLVDFNSLSSSISVDKLSYQPFMCLLSLHEFICSNCILSSLRFILYQSIVMWVKVVLIFHISIHIWIEVHLKVNQLHYINQ